MLTANVCPCCCCCSVEAFFFIPNAPIYSVGTVSSSEEAKSIPRKDIRLGFCNGCGFIYNLIFEATFDYFSCGYEDQQGFSKTFTEYLERVSKLLIEKYDLRKGTFIEIGCGKGDFLRTLVDMSDGKGYGIDPAYKENRQDPLNLTFYKEYYSEKHFDIVADLVCCRHTLEHLQNPLIFLEAVRQLGQEKDGNVFFIEVPNSENILSNGAFWDIYYEHVGYFSPLSLYNVITNAGFKILSLKKDYDDQYLLVEATPYGKGWSHDCDLDESIRELRTLVDGFVTSVGSLLSEWRLRLTDFQIRGRKVVIWGGGSKAVGFLTNFSDIPLIDYVVDINPHIEGNFVPGIGARYVQPEFLNEYRPDVVIVMNSIYREEISAVLQDMKLSPEVYSL